MGARENCYYAALSVCAEVTPCIEAISEAKSTLDSQLPYVDFYWDGKAGSAMNDALSTLADEMKYLAGRLEVLYSNMISSCQYDYSLWPPEIPEVKQP